MVLSKGDKSRDEHGLMSVQLHAVLDPKYLMGQNGPLLERGERIGLFSARTTIIFSHLLCRNFIGSGYPPHFSLHESFFFSFFLA